MSEIRFVYRQMEITDVDLDRIIEMRDSLKKKLPTECQDSVKFGLRTLQQYGDEYPALVMVWKDYESDKECAARLEAEKAQNEREYARYLQLKAKFEQ